MSTKQSDAETFGTIEPVDILPMGGGYDWRQFAPGYGPYFLCKDGLPLRDSSRWNKDGWRVCAVEMGDQQPIRKFAEHVASLREELKEAVALIEKIKAKVIEGTDPNWGSATTARKSRFDIADWCSAFTRKMEGKDV